MEPSFFYYVGIHIRRSRPPQYFPASSRKEADKIAQMAAERAPGRVWIGRLPALTPEEIAVEIERRDPRFAPTPKERERLDAAPFRGTNAEGWLQFAVACHEGLLASYAEGEIDPRRALKLARICSLGCTTKDRIMLEANLVEQMLRIEPKD